MNLLFGLAIGLFSALAFWIVCWLVPKQVWALLPEEAKPWKDIIIRSVSFLIFAVVVWNNAMTYGPRLELEAAHIPTVEPKTVIQSSGDMFESKDRMGVFDNKLENMPIEPK